MPLVTAVVGTILLVCGLILLVHQIRLNRRCKPAHGTVIRLESTYEASQMAPSVSPTIINMHVPVVEFQTATGAVVVAKLPRVSMHKYDVGDTVDFHYDPSRPNRVLIVSPSNWVLPSVLIVAALLCLLPLIFVH